MCAWYTTYTHLHNDKDVLWHMRCLSVLLGSHSWYIGNPSVYVYLFITSFHSWDHGRKTDDTPKWITTKNFKKSIDSDMSGVRDPARGDKVPRTGTDGKPRPWPACRTGRRCCAAFLEPSEHCSYGRRSPKQIHGRQEVKKPMPWFHSHCFPAGASYLLKPKG